MHDARPAGVSVGWRSGAVEIDAAQRCVRVDGAPAKLGSRAMDVLLALVERRERVVSKRELMDVVWPNLVVEENNLLVHMVALRKVLGPRAIATIPGRGYRFVMPVDVERGGGAAASVPPSEPIRGNLPASAPLFGREQDLQAVDVLLREHMVVSIVGAAGIGKTRLALAAAEAASTESPDGRWWVDLASINDGAQIPNAVAGPLGVQLSSGRPPLEALARALARRSMLLALDNCEHLADDIAALIDLLRAHAPNVRLLVTSQESLKCRDEQVYRLGALAVPATARPEEAARFGAVALFIERAHSVDSRFRLADDNVAAVVDICRRLDGIPLAIELAAARVPLLGVHGLHARLNQVFNILSGGMRMKLRRHQTLHAALEWSYRLLSADEQTAFRRLGVFAGGFTLELAQQTVSDERIDPWLVLDLLGHLFDKSLLMVDDAPDTFFVLGGQVDRSPATQDGDAEPRYRLLETTRAFALEQLAGAGESDAMLRRHAQSVCQLMTAIDAMSWTQTHRERRSMLRELGNLRAALDWTLASNADPLLPYQLLGKCWLVWMANGLIDEAVERMLQLWPLPPNLPTRVEADFCRALAVLDVSRDCRRSAVCDEHWEAARRAELLYRQLGESGLLGHALLLVARIGAVKNSMFEAERALREAEALVTEAAPLRMRAALAEAQGAFHLRHGAPELAIEAYRRQAELSRRAGAVRREYAAHGNIGSVQLAMGDLDAAIESLRKSVDGLRRLLPTEGLDLHLGTLAFALAWRGDDIDVLPLAREAFDYVRRVDFAFAPLMAAALQHARRDDRRRAVLLAGYTCGQPRGRPPFASALPVKQRVLDRAAAEHAAARVDAWLHAGEHLTQEQAAAIAFDAASPDGAA
jgi:predicted ATPase/DNA-binding winged helix-turn-helix (wHTH) protein